MLSYHTSTFRNIFLTFKDSQFQYFHFPDYELLGTDPTIPPPTALQPEEPALPLQQQEQPLQFLTPQQPLQPQEQPLQFLTPQQPPQFRNNQNNDLTLAF